MNNETSHNYTHYIYRSVDIFNHTIMTLVAAIRLHRFSASSHPGALTARQDLVRLSFCTTTSLANTPSGGAASNTISSGSCYSASSSLTGASRFTSSAFTTIFLKWELFRVRSLSPFSFSAETIDPLVLTTFYGTGS